MQVVSVHITLFEHDGYTRSLVVESRVDRTLPPEETDLQALTGFAIDAARHEFENQMFHVVKAAQAARDMAKVKHIGSA